MELRQTYQKLIVPDGTLGKCLDPGIQEASLGKNVCVGGGQPSKALPALLCVPKRAAVEIQQR
jgi:hypothetical protein